MRLSPPKKIVWYLSVILGIIGLVFSIIDVAVISPLSVWILGVGWLLLVLGTALTGF